MLQGGVSVSSFPARLAEDVPLITLDHSNYGLGGLVLNYGPCDYQLTVNDLFTVLLIPLQSDD